MATTGFHPPVASFMPERAWTGPNNLNQRMARGQDIPACFAHGNLSSEILPTQYWWQSMATVGWSHWMSSLLFNSLRFRVKVSCRTAPRSDGAHWRSQSFPITIFRMHQLQRRIQHSFRLHLRCRHLQALSALTGWASSFCIAKRACSYHLPVAVIGRHRSPTVPFDSRCETVLGNQQKDRTVKSY